MLINPVRFAYACLVYLLVAWHRRKLPVCEKEYIQVGAVSKADIVLFNIKTSRPNLYKLKDWRHPEKGGQVYEMQVQGNRKQRIQRTYRMLSDVAAGRATTKEGSK